MISKCNDEQKRREMMAVLLKSDEHLAFDSHVRVYRGELSLRDGGTASHDDVVCPSVIALDDGTKCIWCHVCLDMIIC